MQAAPNIICTARGQRAKNAADLIFSHATAINVTHTRFAIHTNSYTVESVLDFFAKESNRIHASLFTVKMNVSLDSQNFHSHHMKTREMEENVCFEKL